jgi:outer membrane porin, OprD family
VVKSKRHPVRGSVTWDSSYLIGAAFAVVVLLAGAMPVFAEDSPTTEPQADTAASAASGGRSGSSASPADADGDVPNSTEQGQVDLSQSFEHRPLLALLHESRLTGLRDTTFDVQLRSFYLDRDNFNTSQSEAWALGGSAGLKTGYFWDFIALGATLYTSQRLSGPADKDGTKLLQTGQQPYTVQGELYGQFRLTDQITAVAGRRAFDTPFINTQDSLMTPNTFEVYAVQGVIGSADTRVLRFGAGYVDQMKVRNSENFASMAEVAGAPGGVDRGVYVAGANYAAGALSIGVIDYYSSDIINIDYTELKYAIPIVKNVRLRFAAQYTDQRSTGDNLLTGKSFATDQFGFKTELAIGTALLTVARTITSNGTSSGPGSGTDIISPWGSYPGYTSVQVENFYRAGEDATMLRAAYNFPKATGLSVYGLWVHGSRPDDANQYAQQEYDANVEWSAQSGALKGLDLRARYAHIEQAGPKDQHEDELRLILNYRLR